MYVTRIPNRDSPPAVLLRESYREGGQVKSCTLANISDWPEAKIDSLRRVLAGETLAPLGAERFEIARALAHGHVAAVLGAVRRLGLDKVLPNGPERRARLILAMIVARIIEPAPKLATDYPGERLIVCRNPELAAERTRKRADLLEATEKALVRIRAMTEKKRNPLHGKDKIALKVGAVIDRRHMAKHFELAITDTSLTWSRKAEAIAAEAALDGVYVIRSSLPGDRFPAAAVVLAYKGLSHAERGFRDIKSGDLDVRPIHHRRAHRVRAHVFLCMLAYYVVWHMKRDLAPMLFKDDDPAAAAALRSSPVAKAKVSPAARRKAISRRTEDRQPVHSFRTLLQDLANLTRNSVRFGDARPTTILSRPTPTQTRAFDLLGLKIAA